MFENVDSSVKPSALLYENSIIRATNEKDNESNNKLEEILCNHCGRTKSNGIRCLGICVADNDY